MLPGSRESTAELVGRLSVPPPFVAGLTTLVSAALKPDPWAVVGVGPGLGFPPVNSYAATPPAARRTTPATADSTARPVRRLAAGGMVMGAGGNVPDGIGRYGGRGAPRSTPPRVGPRGRPPGGPGGGEARAAGKTTAAH